MKKLRKEEMVMKNLRKEILRQLEKELNYKVDEYRQWVMGATILDTKTVRVVIKTNESPYVDGTDLKFNQGTMVLDLEEIEPILHGSPIEVALDWLGPGYFLSLEEPVETGLKGVREEVNLKGNLEEPKSESALEIIKEVVYIFFKNVYHDLSPKYLIETTKDLDGAIEVKIKIENGANILTKLVKIDHRASKEEILKDLTNEILEYYIYTNGRWK